MGGMKSLLGGTPLFEWPGFGGNTIVPERDNVRLKGQWKRVWICMSDGEWHTLEDISSVTGDPPASISARMRDYRKPRFGGHLVQRHHVGNGLFKYRLVIRKE